MGYLLGLDIGSSSVKAGILGLNGRVVAASSHNYPTQEPQPGFKEQHPQLWWEAVVRAIGEVLRGVDAKRLLSIGIAGNICSHTFLDADGKVLRPSLGFQDQRAVAEVEELLSITTREELAQEFGLDLPPAATWPLPRLLWFRKREPAILERTRYLVQAKDFINFRLTGEIASDVSSNRGLVNLSTGLVASQVLKKLKLHDDFLPPLFAPTQVMGQVSAQAAAETGLPRGLPVVTGWNDLNASVLGSGGVREGSAFDVTGTSEHVGVVTCRKHTAPGLICAPFLLGKNLFYGVTSNGGGALTWYMRNVQQDYEDMLRLAENTPAGCDNLLFLPYLDGERAPIWDPRASAAFVGIRSYHSQGHFTRAILEGVALGLLQVLDVLQAETAETIKPIVVSGGAARLGLWNQIKADIWGRQIWVPENPNAAAVGGAILAAVGMSMYESCETAAAAMVRIRERYDFTPSLRGCYRRLNCNFRMIYPALHRLSTNLYEERQREDELVCQQKQR
jgi:xylulokinase